MTDWIGYIAVGFASGLGSATATYFIEKHFIKNMERLYNRLRRQKDIRKKRNK